MFNPSALGIALLVLLATTTMVESSSTEQRSFQAAHRSLSSLLLKGHTQALGDFQSRQTNTISISQAALQGDQPLRLSITAGPSLQGTLTLNHGLQRSLAPSTTLDLRPYLDQGIVRVLVEGTYGLEETPVVITLDGAGTTVRQQMGQAGRLNYQLNLVVD
jgi:hypothetical protein